MGATEQQQLAATILGISFPQQITCVHYVYHCFVADSRLQQQRVGVCVCMFVSRRCVFSPENIAQAAMGNHIKAEEAEVYGGNFSAA